MFEFCRDDASSLVRSELVLSLSYVVAVFEANFVTVCRMAMQVRLIEIDPSYVRIFTDASIHRHIDAFI